MRQTTEQLAAMALLGTGRGGALPAMAGAIGGALAAAGGRGGSAERALLDAAAIGLSCGRAGLVADAAPLRTEAAAKDESPECSRGAAQVLRRLLSGESPEALPEWLELAARRGVRAPHDLLVPLLDLSRRERSLRESVRPVLGERGRWLARLNQEWQFASGARPDLSRAEEQWQTGSAEDRLALLRELREQDPAPGRMLVESTWATDPPELRVKFVDLFAIGLSMDDEPFLETRLDDKRKAVRMSAASLLARLAESRLVGRMAERTLPLVRYEAPRGVLKRGKARLTLTLPKERDAAMARDGVEEVPTQGKGRRTFLLAQMLNHVPPRRWLTEFKITATEFVRAALESEEREVLLRSFLNATLTFSDGVCARALLEEWVVPGLPDVMEGLEAVNAIEPASERESSVLAVLKRHKPATQGLWWLLHAMRHAWSLEFSRALAPYFEMDTQTRTRDQLLAPMEAAAMRLHPAALEALIRGIERHFVDDRSKRADRLISLMHMRHACWKEFNDS